MNTRNVVLVPGSGDTDAELPHESGMMGITSTGVTNLTKARMIGGLGWPEKR